MSDDNIPSQEIPWYRYTAVFSDIINHKQLLQKNNRTNHLSALTDSLPYTLVMLICKLSASRCGCHVDGIYAEVLMYYADDLLLISSAYSDICEVTKIFQDEMK